MEKDLHYYGTYVAAILAGYDVSDSQKIAFSAQYVDDSTLTQINQVLKITGIDTLTDYVNLTPQDWQSLVPGIDFMPIITSQTNLEIFISNIKTTFTSDSENELRMIWVPFHFLPGNFDSDKYLKYRGRKEYSWLSNNWKYGVRSQWEFKLVCRNSSHLVGLMINDLVNSNISPSLMNYLIGIRMHVLADTWSHMWYAGTPSWCINEAGNEVYNITDEKHNMIVWGMGQNSEISTPPSVSFYSAAYLGHSRMGHLPDLPWLSYQYRPQWSNVIMTKSNPADYITGIQQMIAALKCIKQNRRFSVDDMETGIDQSMIKNIYSLLNMEQRLGQNDETRMEERCQKWIEAIHSGKVTKINAQTPVVKDVPSPYNKDIWNSISGDFKQFHLAAKMHRDCITKELLKYNLDLKNPPPYDVIY